jgi:hypothetical protein
VQALRERLRVAQDATLPATLRAPQWEGGVVFVLPPGAAPGMRWHDADGAAPAGASLHGNQAEVRWNGTAPRPGVEWSLCREDGTPVARLTVESHGIAWTVQAADEIQVRPWLALRHDDPPRRFAWRAGSGAPLGAIWTESTESTLRIDAALENPLAGTLPPSLAVLDRETGWALVGGMEFSAEHPAGREIARGR